LRAREPISFGSRQVPEIIDKPAQQSNQFQTIAFAPFRKQNSRHPLTGCVKGACHLFALGRNFGFAYSLVCLGGAPRN